MPFRPPFLGWPRRVAVLPTLALAFALTACGGGGDDDTSPPTVDQTPGTLVSAQFVNHIAASAIADALQDEDSKVKEGITPRYDVDSHRLTYITTDKNGQTTVASGLVSVPAKGAGARSPVLSYQHATTFHDDQAPSNKVEAVEPPLVLASLGYIVVSPDYVGFGVAKGQEHPYLTAAPTASAVLDFLHAAQRWREQTGVADNGQLFLAGYSEGGYATLAAHQAIHRQGGELKASLQASLPGAGPLDVVETLDEQLDRISLLIPGNTDWLKPGRLSQAPESVRQELRRLLLRQLVPDDGDVSYQPLFIDRYLADQRDLLAQEHSVHLGWAPDVPVYLFHGRLDLTVPFSASESARDALRAAGGKDVTLTDCTTPKFGHLDCVPEYFRFAVQRMERLARDL